MWGANQTATERYLPSVCSVRILQAAMGRDGFYAPFLPFNSGSEHSVLWTTEAKEIRVNGEI